MPPPKKLIRKGVCEIIIICLLCLVCRKYQALSCWSALLFYIEFESFLGTKTRVVNYAGLADGFDLSAQPVGTNHYFVGNPFLPAEQLLSCDDRYWALSYLL